MVSNGQPPIRVAYLIGAGGTQACASFVNSPLGVLMSDLGGDLVAGIRERVASRYGSAPELQDLVNTVITETADIEHIITFLDESGSSLHRRLASDLRAVFQEVLGNRLQQIEENHGSKPIRLYAALIDLHQVPGNKEQLTGVLTLNYDDYIEAAASEVHGKPVDPGLKLDGDTPEGYCFPLLKLHGSFTWSHTWPVTSPANEDPLWIPPGIQKAKSQYPFNLIWGRAREILDCDVLRVIGCRLSANDWDLVSMLFSTRLARSRGRAYDIEIIDAPSHAEHLKGAFPYLNVKSLLELDGIGEQLVAEFLGGGPRRFSSLGEAERKEVLETAGRTRNWFLLWLTHKAEDLVRSYGSVETPAGVIEQLLGEIA